MYGMSAPELSLVVVDMTEKAMNAMSDWPTSGLQAPEENSPVAVWQMCIPGKAKREIFTKSSDDLSFSVFSV